MSSSISTAAGAGLFGLGVWAVSDYLSRNKQLNSDKENLAALKLQEKIVVSEPLKAGKGDALRNLRDRIAILDRKIQSNNPKNYPKYLGMAALIAGVILVGAIDKFISHRNAILKARSEECSSTYRISFDKGCFNSKIDLINTCYSGTFEECQQAKNTFEANLLKISNLKYAQNKFETLHITDHDWWKSRQIGQDIMTEAHDKCVSTKDWSSDCRYGDYVDCPRLGFGDWSKLKSIECGQAVENLENYLSERYKYESLVRECERLFSWRNPERAFCEEIAIDKIKTCAKDELSSLILQKLNSLTEFCYRKR